MNYLQTQKINPLLLSLDIIFYWVGIIKRDLIALYNGVADQLCQLDPIFYSLKIGIDPIKWQKKFLRSKSKRIIINTSRQIGKSTTTATKVLARVKKKKQFVIIISPSERQSLELMKKIEEGIALDASLSKLQLDNKLEKVFSNGSRIVALPGNEKTTRGYSGPNLIVIDEASRVEDALFNSISPMLAASKGDLILLSTPYGKSGFFHEVWESGKGWERYEIPATEVPWMTPEFLEEQRNIMGDWWFNQEFMCQFLDPQDTFFSLEDFDNAIDDISALNTESASYVNESGMEALQL